MFANENWDGIANEGFRQAKDKIGTEDVFLSDLYKISLIYTGKALDTIFSLPSPLFPALYENINIHENSILTHVMSRFYIDNGMYSEALHLLYDRIVSGDYTSRTICMLTDASIKAGDLNPTKKFISLLDQTLFYRKKAREYKETVQKSNGTILRVGYNSRTDAYTPDKSVMTQYEKEQQDSIVIPKRGLFEYANVVRLLYKQINIDTLLREAKTSKLLGYKRVPKAIQQAVIISQISNNTSSGNSNGIIDAQTKSEAEEYLYCKGQFYNGEISAKTLSKFFGKNYFHYYDFMFLKTTNMANIPNSSI
jgi:hypothetical protein